MMTTLLPGFTAFSSFTSFAARVALTLAQWPLFFIPSYPGWKPPLSARPADFVTRMVRQQGLRRVDYGQN
ncbi:hypothetical protein, partial [Salmonella sp. s51695]|uniref:hypothetical protein n=1 Tax=Salmonella sp. s51695 TaxID=3159653 RepID=UPI003980CEBC